MLCRYVEANPLRAKLVIRAEQWEWSSRWQRDQGKDAPRLTSWPVERPRHWRASVNEPMASEQAASVQASLKRERPLGSEKWTKRMAAKLGLTQTLKPRGRPRKPDDQLSKRQRSRREKERKLLGGDKV